MPLPSKKLTVQEAIIKARTFCNYRERCHRELKDKLYAWGLWTKDVNHVITQMIEENLLNESRYAESYARGHFYQKRWGKLKIRMELKARGLNDTLIKIAMREIDEKDYQETIAYLIAKKLNGLKGNKYEKQQKVARYLSQKGYQYNEFGKILTEKIGN